MKAVVVDLSGVHDHRSFHELFAKVMGFPDFYGMNYDAWIDCMTDRDDPSDGMAKIHVQPGEVLVLSLQGARELKQRNPEILENLVECTAFVNYRRMEQGQPAVLALSYHV